MIEENTEQRNLNETKVEKIAQSPIGILLNIFLFIAGLIAFLLSLLFLANSFAGTILILIAGLFIFPPTYKLLSNKVPKLNSVKARIVTIFLCIFAIPIVCKPVMEKAYVRTEETLICEQPSSTSKCTKLAKTSLLKVYTSKFKTDGYLRTSDKRWIQESDLTIKGSDEFNNMQKELGDDNSTPDILLTPETIEIQNSLRKEFNKIFSKIHITKNGFEYYINPIVWHATKLTNKEEMMKNCAAFGKIESRQPELDSELALSITRIKSSTNGTIIGSFSALGGFKF